MSKQPNGAILYRGPSLLDGSPIVAIVTGLAKASANSKTGDMLQTWILPDTGASPISHVQAGTDRGVCGTCPFASGGGCYVQVAQGPGAVYRAFLAGQYLDLSDWASDPDGYAIQGTCADRYVRLGAYGDPAAVPVHVWEALTAQSLGWTGYTHQWRNERFAGLRPYVQASCETAGDLERAKAAGWGVFLVIPADLEHLVPSATRCPASEEGGRIASCVNCLKCDGRSGNVVMIRPHGAKSKHVGNVSRRRSQLPVL